MNDDDLRDCFAMFAMHAMLNRDGSMVNLGEGAYRVADAMLEARKKRFWVEPEEDGIASVAKRPYKRRVK
jgi:hypothetical protein